MPLDKKVKTDFTMMRLDFLAGKQRPSTHTGGVKLEPLLNVIDLFNERATLVFVFQVAVRGRKHCARVSESAFEYFIGS